MSTLKLSLEGELRAVAVHAFDQLAAAIQEAACWREDVSDVHVTVKNSEATITMTISASKWKEASEIGSAVFRDAIERTGFTYVENPDKSPHTTKSILNEGSRLTLLS